MFDTDKVIVVPHVTNSPISVARFSGGCKVNNVFYAYVPQRDILVREDWLKAYSAMAYDDFIAALKTGVRPELPKRRRTGNGLKRIKVTNTACRLFEKE